VLGVVIRLMIRVMNGVVEGKGSNWVIAGNGGEWVLSDEGRGGLWQLNGGQHQRVNA
jgi:hypothetical protein